MAPTHTLKHSLNASRVFSFTLALIRPHHRPDHWLSHQQGRQPKQGWPASQTPASRRIARCELRMASNGFVRLRSAWLGQNKSHKITATGAKFTSLCRSVGLLGSEEIYECHYRSPILLSARLLVCSYARARARVHPYIYSTIYLSDQHTNRPTHQQTDRPSIYLSPKITCIIAHR